MFEGMTTLSMWVHHYGVGPGGSWTSIGCLREVTISSESPELKKGRVVIRMGGGGLKGRLMRKKKDKRRRIEGLIMVCCSHSK